LNLLLHVGLRVSRLSKLILSDWVFVLRSKDPFYVILNFRSANFSPGLQPASLEENLDPSPRDIFLFGFPSGKEE